MKTPLIRQSAWRASQLASAYQSAKYRRVKITRYHRRSALPIAQEHLLIGRYGAAYRRHKKSGWQAASMSKISLRIERNQLANQKCTRSKQAASEWRGTSNNQDGGASALSLHTLRVEHIALLSRIRHRVAHRAQQRNAYQHKTASLRQYLSNENRRDGKQRKTA